MKPERLTTELLRSRHVPLAVVVSTLVIFGLVILLARQQLRRSVREQITGRDAQVLYTLLLNREANDSALSLEAPTADPADHLLSILETNQFQKLSVRGTRLFDSHGRFVIAVPEDLPDAQLAPSDFSQLLELQPVSHFHPAVRTSELSFLPTSDKQTVPLLEILLPLHVPGARRLLGVAQFLLDGHNMAGELRALDRNLTLQALVAFVAIGSILTALLGFAFHQLQKANSLLLARTQSLLHANQELALAAKTSAVGAVTAHLIHGLKNPLSGLQSFMTERGFGTSANEDDSDWQAAVSTTRRMQSLINETVRVLREQEGITQYELSLEEFAELINTKMAPAAKTAGVKLCTECSGLGRLTNREANLILLILENLLTNAIQATAAGQKVALEIGGDTGVIRCVVRDQGPGLPEHVRARLFNPCQSTRQGGSGIGLAISKQLANSLSAELELESSSPSGTVFVLTVPIPSQTQPARGCNDPAGAAEWG